MEGVDVDDNTIDSQAWTNLVLGYDRESAAGGNWRLTFNVENLFDADPPIIPSSSTRFGAQSIDNTYDVWGRRYELGFGFQF